MIKKPITLILLLLVITIACKEESKTTEAETQVEKRTQIEMTTTKGKILLELYNETPKHRDNFIKIVNDGVLDSLLFHRVIDQFMVQAGDPESKHAEPDFQLGNGGLEYTVDAEMHPDLFHKRGALGAARDGNPERASSSTQFYIVQRGPRSDSLIDVDQKRINGWLAEHYMQKDSLFSTLFNARDEAISTRNEEAYYKVMDSIGKIAETYEGFERYTIPESHREVYRTQGGTSHLDQNYTVFGEVIEGMNVVDSIAIVKTNDADRPVEDVRILSINVIQE